MTSPIQLDAAYNFQQAALAETYRALSQTHGEVFAAYFIDECRDQVLNAAKTRLCGYSEAGLLQEAKRIKFDGGLA